MKSMRGNHYQSRGKEQTMSRYIDAEWLKSRVHNVPLANGAIHGCVDKLDLIEAPSIEIVRCRECKYFWKYSDLPTKCVFHLSLVKADDFCSYGEREGE